MSAGEVFQCQMEWFQLNFNQKHVKEVLIIDIVFVANECQQQKYFNVKGIGSS